MKQNQTKEAVAYYKNACNFVRDEFVQKYFKSGCTYYWIADDIGGILSINDYFFDMDTMVMALERNVKPKWLFEFCEWSVEDTKETRNLNYFLNLKRIGKL